MEGAVNQVKELGIQTIKIVGRGSLVVKPARGCYARRMPSSRDVLKTFTQGFHSLLFPSLCLGCQQPLEASHDLPLCLECARQLPRSRPPWCLGCGRSLAGAGAGVDRCRECRLRRPFPFDRVITPFLYESPIRQLVWALKYQARISLIPFFADWMVRAVKERRSVERPDLCVPVPLHSTRLRERSFNQAERLGRALAERLHLPFRADLLVRGRATLPQIALPREMRRLNLQEAFSLNPKTSVQGLKILLVDDIFTTGSTAGACAQLLKQAGAAHVTVAALAHG